MIRVERDPLAKALRLAVSVCGKEGPLRHVRLRAGTEILALAATRLADTVETHLPCQGESAFEAHVDGERLLGLVAADPSEVVELGLKGTRLEFRGRAKGLLPILNPELYPTLPEPDPSHEARSFSRDALAGALQRASRFRGDGRSDHYPSAVYFVLEGSELAVYAATSAGIYRETVEVVGVGDFEFRLEPAADGLLKSLPDAAVAVRPGSRFVWLEGERHRVALLNSEATIATSSVQATFEKSIANAEQRADVSAEAATSLRFAVDSLSALVEQDGRQMWPTSMLSFEGDTLRIEGPTFSGEAELPGWPAVEMGFKTRDVARLRHALAVLEGEIEMSWHGCQMLALSAGYRTVVLPGQVA
jgi:hypothetical protein